ncbi:MAG TPA: DUF4185 domain-containing protein [Iamia sp.]
MAGRQRRRGLGVLLALVAIGAAVGLVVVADPDPAATPRADPAPDAPEAETYANPLADGVGRNPSVVRAADGSYYAYVDGFDMGVPFHVGAYRSPDLATWTMVGDVLDDPGAWADPSSGRRFTTPSVRHVPSNPAGSRYVMYLTGPTADGTASCIGVATAAAPDGPFVGADQPLICPPGGARAASPVPGSDQVVYRAEQPVPGVYALALTADGTAVAAGAEPALLLGVADGVLREGVLERPAVARDADGAAYLFVRTGDEDDGVGWSPCVTAGPGVTSCADRTRFGSWLTGMDTVAAVGGLQVFTDGEGASWIAYDAQPAASCTGATCTGLATLRIDKLCFAHGVPRTNGPSTGPQTRARPRGCSADVPGRSLEVAAADDDDRVDHPPEVSFRDGGSSVPLGGRLLWLFSDTYIDRARSGRDGPCFAQGASRSNSAGLGLPHPLAGHRGYTSPLGTVGPDGACAGQFIPLTDDETFFNYAQSPVGRRVVLWENGGFPLADGSALVFFVKGVQDRDADGSGPDPGCAYCYEYRGQGVVRVAPGQTVADRASTAMSCDQSCLFGPADDGWSGRPFVVDGVVYVYSDTPASGAVRLGRVPVAEVEDRSAWTFRTATGGWSPSIADAAAIPGLAVRPPAVAYNGYLDRFVTVVAAGSDVVAVQTAPEPWGPWSEPTPIYDWGDLECGDIDAYGPIATPALDDGGGRVIRFTFSRPGPDFGRDPTCPGEVRLVSITLSSLVR